MGRTAIRVEGIGKRYRLGRAEANYKTLRDTIADVFSAPFRKVNRLLRGGIVREGECPDEIWALKDVGFEVEPGEVVGIIGRNGAGKSTLLKILSRITEPTSGYAEIHGRVGSLLEVGTGFHAELSGRENIYLNGAILGMSRSEIKRAFDDIVAFAEVDKFVDTPVKHYSSGMYLRLAFAVAAHLNPEILIVDEVLAVGDARFQKKCLAKMEDVGQKGRTVLFVSHSMPSITRLCKRVILLEGGMLKTAGPAHKVVNNYLNNGYATTAAMDWPDPVTAPGRNIARLRSLRVRSQTDEIIDTVNVDQTFGIEMEFDVLESGCVLMPYHHFFNEDNINIFMAHDTDPQWRRRERPRGRYRSTVWIPGNLLSEGMLFVTSGVTRVDPEEDQFCERDIMAIHVVDETGDKPSARGDWPRDMGGVVRPMFNWSTQFKKE